MKPYLIDTSVMIEAKNRYYGFDLCPGFWDALIKHNSDSIIQSIDKVKEEINDPKYEDDLRNWVNDSVPNKFFNSTEDDSVLEWYVKIINWVQHNPQFKDPAKAEFIQGKCDPYLIAYAKANNCVVISKEAYLPNVQKRVPIPNVCKAFDVEFEDIFKVLKKLGVKFSLKDNDE